MTDAGPIQIGDASLEGGLALAMKYFRDGLPDQGVAMVRELIAAADPEAALGLAGILHRASRPAEAAEAYRAALSQGAFAPAVWNGLGLALEDASRPGEALKAFETAIEQAPEYTAPRINMAALLAGQGQFAAAAQACREALARDPDSLPARINLGAALVEQGRHAEAQSILAAARAAAPHDRAAADAELYLHHYMTDDPAVVFAAHRRWGESQPTPARPVARSIANSGAQRLRVGYVSPDFRRHSVSFFFEPLLGAHDRGAVEIFCYADSGHADVVTARLRAAAEHWREIAGLDDEAVAAAVAEDGIDVLIDLAGHTRGNRLGLFARRAAPVQITAIGYPGTTGLGTMDCRLCDALTDPQGADRYATEHLLRLPRLHCYRPPADAPTVGPLPASDAGHVTFGSFNKLGKVSDGTIALWAAVLEAVPRSRLFLKSKALAEEETRAITLERFAKAGIAAERLTLFGWVPEDTGHLGAYGRVDIALDTFPYTGTATTCEALWMGVPVVTLSGRTHASRVSASLLSTVGLADWIAESRDGFVARAVKAAADIEPLARLRAGLRQQVAQSPLCDAAGYAAAVEAAYRAARAMVT